MPQILGIRIQNFRSLADITFGQVAFGEGDPLPSIMCFIGPNGSGKSSVLDALGFIADCLREGVESACDKPHRGGFQKLRTQGVSKPISFTLYFRQASASRPISYEFSIDERSGTPVVVKEKLRQRRKGQTHGQPFPFVDLKNGRGDVWTGESTEREEGNTKEKVELDDVSRLAITSLGQFTDHPRIVALRKYIEDWYLSYFVPDASRGIPAAGAQKHLDRTGANLANFVQYLERSHKSEFRKVLDQVAKRIPGIQSITHKPSPDGRLLLQFNEGGYKEPFFQQSMSDGTLKVFAYLMLLFDPEPHTFVGIEEPENGLYHKLLQTLGREFRDHAENSAGKLQMLVTTHSPYFVDSMKPEFVWLLEKSEKGRTSARRLSDLPAVVELVNEGIPLGSLWYSNEFDERFVGLFK